jgi:hypothetical protein
MDEQFIIVCMYTHHTTTLIITNIHLLTLQLSLHNLPHLHMTRPCQQLVQNITHILITNITGEGTGTQLETLSTTTSTHHGDWLQWKYSERTLVIKVFNTCWFPYITPSCFESLSFKKNQSIYCPSPTCLCFSTFSTFLLSSLIGSPYLL